MHLKTKRLPLIAGFCAFSYLALVAFLLLFIFKPLPTDKDFSVSSVVSNVENGNDGCLLTLRGQCFPENIQAYLNLDIGNRFSIVGNMPSWGFAKSVAVQDNLGFILDMVRGFQIVDLTDVSRPQIIASLSVPGRAWDLAVQDDRAYIAADTQGMHVVSLQDPASPQIIATVDTPGTARDILVDNAVAYIADGGRGVHIVDLRQKPHIIATVEMPGVASGLWKDGDFLYVAAGKAGMHVVDCKSQKSRAW